MGGTEKNHLTQCIDHLELPGSHQLDYNKILQPGWLKEQKFMSFKSSGGKTQINVQQGLVSGESWLPDWQIDAFLLCAHMSSLCACGNRESFLVSLIRTQILLDEALNFMILFDFNYFLIGSVFKKTHMGGYSFNIWIWGVHIESIILRVL